MMTGKQPIQYHVDIFDNDFPMRSYLIDIMSQIRLPGGEILNTRMQEDLDSFHLYENLDIVSDVVADKISFELIGAMRKDIKNRVKEIVCQRLGQIRRNVI